MVTALPSNPLTRYATLNNGFFFSLRLTRYEHWLGARLRFLRLSCGKSTEEDGPVYLYQHAFIFNLPDPCIIIFFLSFWKWIWIGAELVWNLWSVEWIEDNCGRSWMADRRWGRSGFNAVSIDPAITQPASSGFLKICKWIGANLILGAVSLRPGRQRLPAADACSSQQ